MYKLTNTDSIIRIADGACIPADPANTDYAAYLEWVAAGNTPEPYIEPPFTLRDYDIAIERHLDAEAEVAGYYDPLGRIPNIDRACSYAGYVNQYQAESQSFVAWRAAVWAHAFQVKSDVEANVRAQPSIEELIAELPARVIPE